MSVLWRNWLSMTAILGLAILRSLALLQHNSILAMLLKQRLSVVAQSTAGDFRPVATMGLPLSMLRNAQAVLREARANDANIRAIYITEHDGSVIHTDGALGQAGLAPAVLHTLQQHQHQQVWSSETDTALTSAAAIVRGDHSVAGWVLVFYTKDAFNKTTRQLERKIIQSGLGIWGLVSLLAWGVLRRQLGGAVKGFAQVQRLLAQFAQHRPGQPLPDAPDTNGCGLFIHELPRLHRKLSLAATRYARALHQQTGTSGPADPQPGNTTLTTELIKQAPDTSMARALSRRLAPALVMLVVAVVLLQGWQIYRQVLDSFEPEQSVRLELIGSLANRTIQRAVSAGVPLNSLVGASRYFEELLHDFPEVSYLAMTAHRLEVEAGQHVQPRPDNWWSGRDETSVFPITDNAGETGRIIVEANPHYFAQQLQNLTLDLAMVMVVAMLLAYQVVVVTLSLSMTGPLNRLNHLLIRQSRGDFSCRLGHHRHSALDRAAAFLSARADTLCQRQQSAGNTCATPRLLRFAYLNDIRLPVFLFGVADALSISFLPVYTRLLDNPLHWLNAGVVLSLPLAGYLLAITLGAPLVRALNARWGVRRLLLLAALLMLAANAGMAAAVTTVDLIIFRTLAGLGYAAATLAGQDYLLDVVPREMRGRALGLFTSALFSGIFSGAAVGGLIADRSGPPAVFLTGALIALVAAVLVWCFIPPDPRQTAGSTFRLADLLQPLRNTRFIVLITGLAIPANVMIQGFIAFLVALQMNALGATAADVARMVMLYFLLLLLIAPVAPRLDKHLHISTRAILGALLAATALGVAAIWPGYWSMLYAVAGAGAGAGQGLMRDAAVAIAITLAESDLAHLGQDTVLGSLRMVERAGSIIGLLATAWLASQLGYSAGIAAIALWLLTGMLVLLMAKLTGTLSY